MFSHKLDRFLNSPYLHASVFLIAGASKTHSDYRHADENYKNKFLIKDSLILAGAAAGMFAQKKFSPKITDIKFMNKLLERSSKYFEKTKMAQKLEKPMDFGKEIIIDSIKNVSMFASGILGALCTDLILSNINYLNTKGHQKTKSHDVLNKSIHNIEKVTDVGLNTVIKDKEIKDAIYNRVTDMPQLGALTSGFVGVDAIDLAKETELKTKLKHTGSCIINNAMLPMLYLSIANAITKGMKPIYKIPAIFGTLVAGTLITSKLNDMRINFLSRKAINETKKIAQNRQSFLIH